jgi:hypothetical protein
MAQQHRDKVTTEKSDSLQHLVLAQPSWKYLIYKAKSKALPLAWGANRAISFIWFRPGW